MKIIEAYKVYLQEIRKMSPVVVNKNLFWLGRIESHMRMSLLEARLGSQVQRAIICAANKRKTVNNGGVHDDGTGYRFRLGQAAACYLAWAYSERVIDRNPFPKNVFPVAYAKEANFHDEARMQFILDKIEGYELRDHLIVRLLLDTGVRVSELCMMKIEDFDFKERNVSVFMNKVKRLKRPCFTKETGDLVRMYINKRREGYLLVTRDKKKVIDATIPLTTNAVRLRLRQIGKEIGIRINPHSFRHTMVTLWLTNGATETDATTQAGHIDTKQVRKTYAHLSTSHIKKVQDRVMEKVFS